VVPTHDRLPQLERCLVALAAAYPVAHLLVVDDGSAAAADVAAIARANGADVVRHDTPQGPSAARNSGLRGTTASLIAFVDSDVVVEPGCLERLAGHFADQAVGAAAPRVLALEPGTTRLARCGGWNATPTTSR
jgi:glycosyltransferase involved in cell wall biosynthesis